ncbi:hypothetical protein HN587_03425 [Candidatus Woesearchaeota archaeon]|jgi:cyanophycin synthetase|nr:hypothetical protein [Candidatus Woesearchaeota archaeon]
MLNETELQGLHTNQRLLIIELQNRGINVNSLVPEMELVEAEYHGHKEFILDRDSSINPYPSTVISGDKYLSKKLLAREGISVVSGEQFDGIHQNEALVYAQKLNFPLVVKPVFGSHGHGVYMDLDNLCDVKDAIDKISGEYGSNKTYLVEEQFEGKEYRVFITQNGDYAVLHRDCAHIIGDGTKTIEQLANQESENRMTESDDPSFPRKNCLCPVQLDEVVNNYLARQQKDTNYVPPEGEKIYLRHNSNVAVGATCEDYTDIVHPSIIEIAKKALNAFPGLPYAGLDFLSKDITKPQTADMYRLLEVNSIPGIHMHMRPGTGKSQNVAKYLVDMMFPETKYS